MCSKIISERKLTVNKKILIFKKEKHNAVQFGKQYRTGTEYEKWCEVQLKGQLMEDQLLFSYFGSVFANKEIWRDKYD